MQEYNKVAKEPYFFENAHCWYVSSEALRFVESRLWDISHEGKEKIQTEALFAMERLKLNLAEGAISESDYRVKLIDIVRDFYNNNGFPVLDETDAVALFYKILDEFYRCERTNTERGN